MHAGIHPGKSDSTIVLIDSSRRITAHEAVLAGKPDWVMEFDPGTVKHGYFETLHLAYGRGSLSEDRKIRFGDHQPRQDETVNGKVRELAVLDELDHPGAGK